MKRLILPGALFLLTIDLTFGQDKSDFYTSQWSEVHKYELQYLPKSALAITDSIYIHAKKNKNYVQVVKAMIFQAKFATMIKEDHELYIVNHFKNEIDGSEVPIRNILESMLAKIYWEYYQKNRWRFYRRSRTSEKVNKEDFRTWDLSTLFEEINRHFQNSLLNPELLQAIDPGEIDELLITYDGSGQYRPTLFDFMAHNALAFYSTSESGLTQPAGKFEIRDEGYFDSPDFDLFQTTTDTLSLDLNALQLYQRLSRFHESRKDTSAYVMLELERLEFLKTHGIFDNPDQLHFNALLKLKDKFSVHPASTLIDFKLAEILFNEGATYIPNKNDAPQFKIREALEICDLAIDRFPESTGAGQCRLLKTRIQNPALSLMVESFIPIETPSRILVRYTNIDALSFSALRISENQKKQYQRLKNDSSRLAFIKQLKQVEFWDINPPDLNDYQEHTTEAILPPLAQGQYMIVAKTPDFEDIYGYAFTQTTDLVMVEKSMDKVNRYQVVNRNNGAPVSGAHIHLSNFQKHRNKLGFDTLVVTDERGFAMVKKDDKHHSGLTVLITSDRDTARFGNHYLRMVYPVNNESENDKPIYAKPFIFTDRSIYRPGQKIFFKGVLTKKQGDKIDVVSGEFVEMYFYDPNDDEVSYLRLKTNEFGSFSGEFKIPSSGLTGKYYISAEEDYEEDSKFYDDIIDDFEWNELYISVEEYKRPRYEVSFDPVTGSHRLMDTLTVNGKAIAFTGAPVTGAKVVYSVTRTVRYPPWYYWRNRRSYHTSASREITNGETTTTSDGSFLIDFKAIPDEQVAKDELPVFEYQITADVTDINGESRSAETIVKVGYHTMNITIDAPDIIVKNRKRQPIRLAAQNLNGQRINATGTLHVYQLRSPDRILRDRPWPAPDQQMLSREEFIKLFPHDSYGQDTGEENPEKEKMVYTTRFDTESVDSVLLPVNEQWEFGNYIIELESKDEFNQLVKSKSKFSLRDVNHSGTLKNTIVFHSLDKPDYHIGEKVEFTIGTASKDATVTIDIEKDHKVVSTHVIPLSNENYTLKIPINKNDAEGFAIHYHLVNFNDFKTGTQVVNVSETNEQLQIETATFRDKLLPGAKETWSFRIKGPNKAGQEAEVLASMYDASLDQFKSHSWSFNPMPKSRYRSYKHSSANDSFGNRTFIIRNLLPPSFYLREQRFDQLDWFGFSIDNNKYLQRQYLNRMRVIYYDTIRQVSKVSISNDNQQQKGLISGQTRNASGELLPGVNVLIKGTNKGTVTDINGRYSILATKGEELVFSFIGYASANTTIGKGNVIDVQMAPDVQMLSEVVVVGHGVQKKASLTGSVVSVVREESINEDISLEAALRWKLDGAAAGVTVTNEEGIAQRVMMRGLSSFDAKSAPLYIVDGVPVTSSEISESDLASISVLKGDAATFLYGSQAANGVILITTKSGQKKMDEALAKVRARKNLKETAFFYPHLKTNKKGRISFSFTTPEALTRWKLQLLAHTQNLAIATKTLQAVTTKDLMIIPNTPRFLRQGDEVVISAKITNLTNRMLEGFVGLQLSDPFTEDDANGIYQNLERNKPFKVDNKGNTEVSWKLFVPEDTNAVQYKIVARSGNFSDGEQNILPILSNRTLVTETLPMHIKTGKSKTFTLNKLKTNNSPTLQHHRLTLEVTSNPTWYALQALPYLMEYPYECAEQIFARYYANALAIHILNQNKNIKKVFENWAANGSSSGKLENNEELKSIIIQETPWLRDALSEKEQKERIARLFDNTQTQQSLESAIYKLEQMQLGNGGFPWFGGSSIANRYITQHIIAGLAHLHHLNVDYESFKTKGILKKGLKFLEKEILNDYNKLLKRAGYQNYSKASRAEFMSERHINANHIHYLYLRSYFPDSILSDEAKPAIDYYKKQSATYWQDFGVYMKGMIAMEKFRSDKVKMARSILHSLKETSITNEELGMYWKDNISSWRWDQAPIETQALLIEAFSEIEASDTTISVQQKLQTIDNLKIWLLKNKQTNRWNTTKSTTEAIYALLLKGSDWLSITEQVDINLGSNRIMPELLNDKPEAATGYFKKSWTSEQIDSAMSEVTLTKKDKDIAWGGLYWQYFEDLDKITPAETPLKLSKSLFKVSNSEAGELLHEVTDGMELNVGDRVRVRIELTADRYMEFLHMKDMRAAGLEPTNVLSEYKWQDGLGYYESTRDASTNFFFNRLPKGVYVFEYDLRANNKGNFSDGITSIQSMYAPEFSSHSEGVRLVVK